MAHRHKDSRAKWTTTDAEPEVAHPADVLTQAEVTFLKVLLVAHGPGGTTPLPPNPPPAGDVTAPTVSGVSASVTTTTATIVATTDEAATVQVEYNTTGVWPGTLTAATSSGTSHSRTLTGLTPGQTYVYRVRATDTAGNLRLDTNRTFTTTSAATLPGAPTGLTATGGNTQVVLNWSAPASNGGSAITGYRVFRNGASLVVLGNVLTYTNTGLTNGLTYSYTVAAITAVGEGPQGASASATPATAGDIDAPIISNVAITGITQTGATVTCTTNEPATVIVEYGTTTYGLQTTATSSGTSHSRTLSGLTLGTTYHLRIRATDTAGNLRLDSDRTFTTTGTIAPIAPVYGTGMEMDSKWNIEIGKAANRMLSFRFRASQASQIAQIAVDMRCDANGSYSQGDGGTWRVTIQRDSGGEPSGTALSLIEFDPGNTHTQDSERFTYHSIPSGYTPSVNELLHIVIENIASDRATNWISVNCDSVISKSTPRQPAFSDDFATLYRDGTGPWKQPGSAVGANDPDPAKLTGVFDLVYANGQHDGNAVFQVLVDPGQWGECQGANTVRQTFTVSGGSRTVTTLAVRMKRISGSGNATLRLDNAAGSVIEQVSVPTTVIPLSGLPRGDLSGGRWLVGTIPSTVITNGTTYALRVTTDSATRLIALPIQPVSTEVSPTWGSRAFRDGQAERSTNSGGSWSPFYAFKPESMQFYVK